MKHFNLIKTFLLLFALVVGGGSSAWAEDVTDVLTAADLSATSTTYKDFSGVTKASSAVYAGNSAKDASNNIQLRSKNSSGIVTTTSGGKVKSITITVASGSNTIDVYGSNTAYTSASDLYNSSKQGTKIGSTSQTATITVTGDYTYVGIRSNNGAVYLTSVEFTYISNGGGTNTIEQPTFSVASGAITAGTTVSLEHPSADAIRYTTDGTEPTKTVGNVYSNPIEITTATTIKAIAIKGDDVSTVASASYTITVDAPTFDPESGSYLQGSTFTMSASGNSIYYNLTTDGSTPSDPTLSSTKYTDPIVINGTTKIKAIAVDTYGNTSSVVTRTYTGIAPAILPFSWNGTSSKGKSDLDGQTGVTVTLASDYASSNAPYRLKFDGAGKNIVIYTDVIPAAVSFTAKLFNATSTGSEITVQESSDGIDFSDVETFLIAGSANKTFSFTTTMSFSSDTRAIKLIMTKKDQNVGVGSIYVSKFEPITISSAGYATYCSSYPLDFTGITTLTAYTATKDVDGVKFNKVEGKVPANTGLLVSGETTDVPVCTSADPVDNLLVGVTTETVKDANTIFVLMNGSKGIGFYKNANDFTLRANSAYLPAEAVETAGARTFIGFDDDTTGIAEMNTQKEDVKRMFDLQGRKVTKAAKGLYIVDGRKVVVK